MVVLYDIGVGLVGPLAGDDVVWSWVGLAFDNLEGPEAPDVDRLAADEGVLDGLEDSLEDVGAGLDGGRTSDWDVQ